MMDALASFHFLRPYWLFLVVPCLILSYVAAGMSDVQDRWKGVIAPELLSHLLVGGKQEAKLTPNILLLATWIIGIIAVAGPTWSREPSPFADARPPVVVVLRVAPSMQTPDLAPTRLDRARQKLTDILALREGAATGLIAYAGSAHLVVPPTPDKTVVMSMANALEPRIMPKPGDDLAAAVALARNILADDGRGGSILIITDGVASAQIEKLAGDAAEPSYMPATLLAMLPPQRADDDLLVDAAKALDARLVATTIDQTDVVEIARRLDRVGQPQDVAGEGQHWREYGYWLTPFLALIVLGWFRRGWVMA